MGRCAIGGQPAVGSVCRMGADPRHLLYLSEYRELRNAEAAYNVDGFEVGVHVSSLCDDWTPTQLASLFSSAARPLAGEFSRGCLLRARTGTHCIRGATGRRIRRWSGKRHPPRDEPLRLSLGMGSRSGPARPLAPACRCVSPTSTGRAIDVYQATTQTTDESAETYPFNPSNGALLLLREPAPRVTTAAFVAHLDTEQSPGRRLLDVD